VSAHINRREASSTLRRRVTQAVYKGIWFQEWEELMETLLHTVYQRIYPNLSMYPQMKNT